MIATVLASALIAGPAAVAAGGFPGLPDAATYGHCQAYNHADDDAKSNATAFENATYEEGCEAYKPQPQDDHADEERDERAEASDDRGDRGHATADERRPDHAGPP